MSCRKSARKGAVISEISLSFVWKKWGKSRSTWTCRVIFRTEISSRDRHRKPPPPPPAPWGLDSLPVIFSEFARESSDNDPEYYLLSEERNPLRKTRQQSLVLCTFEGLPTPLGLQGRYPLAPIGGLLWVNTWNVPLRFTVYSLK